MTSYIIRSAILGTLVLLAITFIPAGTLNYWQGWALLLVLPFFPILYFRIANEEKVLVRDLPGYTDYMRKVRWRLIPGIF